jgi:hypothetical protein
MIRTEYHPNGNRPGCIPYHSITLERLTISSWYLTMLYGSYAAPGWTLTFDGFTLPTSQRRAIEVRQVSDKSSVLSACFDPVLRFGQNCFGF